MNTCIIHVDGSYCSSTTTKNKHGLGWGLVAEHHDRTHEKHGGYLVQKNQDLNGAHEDIALFHALQYMRGHGFTPQTTHIYCDDDLLGYAPTYLAKENYQRHKAELIEKRIARAASFTNQTNLVPLIMEELRTVRLNKVKGHQGHVYQERVNYLAKWSAHLAVGKKTKRLSFGKWLDKGFTIYMPPEKPHPTLVELGLVDAKSHTDTTTPYKPRIRVEYAAFVRTIASPESKAKDLSATFSP